MKVLVVGEGGREHAIIWKIKQSPKANLIYCAPGNGGISQIAECVDIKPSDIEGLLSFALKEKIDLTIVGPEVPLVLGIVDEFEKNGLRCFGPRINAAIIEGSKVFSKKLMKDYNIPTPGYDEFRNPDDARAYLSKAKYPLVIKADGLAAGKGVIIAKNYDEASAAIHDIMETKVFNEAGNNIIIEEFIEGPEVSVLAFTDGKCVKPMASSRDHKRIFDNNQGPNTGGMGAISPNPDYTPQIEKYCMENIFIPTLNAMNNENRKFKGILYFGLILSVNGPKLLEYNCRFGDPETQVVLPRLESDLLDIMNSVIDETLEQTPILWNNQASACIVTSSGGYPGPYEKGKKISGLNNMPEDIIVFHSGTKLSNNITVTNGGRVLGVTALGSTIPEATEKVYSSIENINFEGMHYRRDIGK